MMDIALVPFFLLLLLYLVTFSPHLGRAPEAWGSVLLKILPVWYLAAYVAWKSFRLSSSRDACNQNVAQILKHTGNSGIQENGVDSVNDATKTTNSFYLQNVINREVHDHEGASGVSNGTKHETLHGSNEAQYKYRFLIGLLVSSIGDACLVYKSLFKVGILAFGVAQLMYLLAFKHRHRKSCMAWVAVPLCITLNLILAPGIDEIVLNILVLGYSLLIHSMLFYAMAGYESFPSRKSLSTMIGACLFIASDFLIAFNKWVTNTPYAEASILLTYYTAQFLLTAGMC